MRVIAAGQFKQHCLSLLDEVGASGEAIVITKRGKPVAQLSAISPERSEDWRGALSAHGQILGDLVAPAADGSEWAALNS